MLPAVGTATNTRRADFGETRHEPRVLATKYSGEIQHRIRISAWDEDPKLRILAGVDTARQIDPKPEMRKQLHVSCSLLPQDSISSFDCHVWLLLVQIFMSLVHLGPTIEPQKVSANLMVYRRPKWGFHGFP